MAKKSSNGQGSRAELLRVLEALRPGLAEENKAGVKPQECAFTFIGNRMVTFNGEVSVSVDTPDLLDGLQKKAVAGKPLLQLLDRMTGDKELKVSMNESEVRLESGRIRAGVPLLDALDETRDWSKDPTVWTKLPKGFTTALRFCMYACGKDMSVPALTCVSIRAWEGIVEATDNFRATRYAIKTMPTMKDQILIPASSIKDVVVDDFVELATTDGWLHLRTEDKTVASMRTFDAKFPDVEEAGIFKKGKKERKLTIPKRMDEVLDRLTIFAARDYFLDERIRISLTLDKMSVRAEGHQGWIEEELKIQYGDEDESFDINPTFLKEILESTRGCSLGDRRLRFTGEDWQHVVSLIVE